MRCNKDNNISKDERRLHKVVSTQNLNSFKDKLKLDFSLLRKGLMIIGISLLLTCSCRKDSYVPQISINEVEDDCSFFASYSLGKVYICFKDDFDMYQQLLQDDDILVVDNRNSDNPDMCIYNSCKITDAKVIMEVLLILEEYEKRYPSYWNRTLSSMYNEWVIHNICYSLSYRTESTEHVDLDNEDEKVYSSLVFKILLNTR